MKKNFALIAVLVVLAAAYAIFFTDWFRPKTIVISHTMRPIGRNGQPLLIFALGNRYRLTEIKVVPLDEWQTNKLAQPLWHLVSSGSEPVNHFIYGQNLPRMSSAVKGARAEPLEPGIAYRIFISAGSTKGSQNFQIGPGTNAPPRAGVSSNP